MPLGAVLPASLSHPPEGTTPAQVAVLESIYEEFVGNVPIEGEDSSPASPASDVELVAAESPQIVAPLTDWSEATQIANERYRQLFGVQAFNAWSAAAAREALAERQPPAAPR